MICKVTGSNKISGSYTTSPRSFQVQLLNSRRQFAHDTPFVFPILLPLFMQNLLCSYYCAPSLLGWLLKSLSIFVDDTAFFCPILVQSVVGSELQPDLVYFSSGILQMRASF